MITRLCFALLLLCSGAAQAGYSATAYCYATMQEAASRAAYYYNGSGQCASGECRILSYVPTSGTAQVISNGRILTLTIPACDVVNATLPSYIQPSPWYGSDPGTVSACGSTVNTTGGIAGSGSGYTEMTPAQKAENYKGAPRKTSTRPLLIKLHRSESAPSRLR